MGGRIPEETIDLIRDRTDITQVISAQVSLKRSGGNFLGLCPFHTEKTPSFNVSPERQTFHCFGCGTGGNVFTYLMRLEGLTFPEVVERLARERGIELPRREASPAEAQARSERERLREVTSAARDYFEAQLAASAEARAYVAERGVGDETVKRYHVGYAPDGWTGLAEHLERKGFTAGLGVKAGLLIPRKGSGHYDRFRHRVVFPIHDLNGNVLGFGGRALSGGKTGGEDAKYLNSPETPLYDKGRALFGILEAREAVRRAGRVVVVEGYFDAILLAQSGIDNVVAPCGTALTDGQVRVLRRFAEDIVTVFDSDDAGRRATERAMHLFLEEGVQGYGVGLPEGLDPDDYVRQHGPDSLQQDIRLARPLLEEWVVRQAEGLRSFAERGRRAAVIGAVLQKIKNPVELDLYMKLAAERLHIEERLMREHL
ncbi:MAG: DNA primase, partial [Deltaproteobacteria bacterium]|nr:DNA primase [Deltaproteobacteria bacterium]